MKKNFLIFIFLGCTFFSFSQEKFSGNWLSVGYLEASKIKMYDVDTSYIDSTIYTYKTSPIFLEIEQNELELTSFLPIKNKKPIETKFQLKFKNDTAQVVENNVTNGQIFIKDEMLELQFFSSDGLLSRTNFYVKNNHNISSKISLNSIKKQLISNKWGLGDLKSTENSSSVELIFTEDNQLSIANPYGASVSDYKIVEYENSFYIIFENDYAANYMKIVEVSDKYILIEMPVNKKFETFKLTKQ